MWWALVTIGRGSSTGSPDVVGTEAWHVSLLGTGLRIRARHSGKKVKGMTEYSYLHNNVQVWVRDWGLVIHIDGLVQERRNTIANAVKLHLYFTNPSIYTSINLGLIGSANASVLSGARVCNFGKALMCWFFFTWVKFYLWYHFSPITF